MTAPEIDFVPSPDVAAILNALLDTLERREPPLPLGEGNGVRAGRVRRAIRVALDSLPLPAYHSQTDPEPRQLTNYQLLELERAGLIRLTWLRGETGHLLASVTLVPERADAIFTLLNRTPQAARRARLTDLLLGERFRFKDWRLKAIQDTLTQLKEDKSPGPFNLADEEFNRDLLVALAALDDVKDETPYRVFSVRVFNDSKRFEALKAAVVTLARRSRSNWRGLSNEEILRELNLVANPGHLYLHGPWQLVDETGQVISLGEFHPPIGLPAAQAARLRKVTVNAPSVLCIENPTTFYEHIRATHITADHLPHLPLRSRASAVQVSAIRHGPSAALCLWGNPSPACRHLLRLVPEETPLFVWADLDYGGLNILAHLREQVSPRIAAYRMDVATLEAHVTWARPLNPHDVKNLTRLLRRPALKDMQDLIKHMLERGLKLEQEAVIISPDDTSSKNE